MKRPLFTAGLSAFCGIVLCMALGLRALFAFAALLAADLVFCLLRKKEALRVLLTATAAGALGALLFFAHTAFRTEPSFAFCGTTATVCGQLAEPPAAAGGSTRLVLKNCEIGGAKTRYTVTVYVTDPGGAALFDTVACEGVQFWERPAQDEFYYHTLSSGRWLGGYARQAAVTAVYGGDSPGYRIALLRQKAEANLYAALPQEEAGIAAALLLGRTDGLSAEFRTGLRIAGASHIFAVSGMHLSLWAGVFFFVLRARAKTKKWANLAAAAFVVFYAALTGFSPSVLRAGIMLLTVLCGRMLKKAADPLNSLGLAAFLLLCVNPFLAGNVSFLLSFFATAAILVLFPYFFLPERDRDAARLLRAPGTAAVNAAGLSFCVLFFTVPVSGIFFGGVSLLSPVSSLLGVLPAEGVMLTSAGGLLFGFLRPVSTLLFRLAAVFAGMIETMVDRLSAADFLYTDVTPALVILWYLITLACAAAVYYLTKKNRQAVVDLLVFSAALALIAGGGARLAAANAVRVRLINSGNVTAVCVKSGGGAYLIGAGGSYDEARNTADALTRAGVLQPDALILPGAGAAESGQLPYFSERYRFDAVFTAAEARKFFPDTETYGCAPCFRLELPGGAVYTNFSAGAFTAGLLEGRTKLVFSYSPANDFSAFPALQTGDCLVCRGGLPKGIDPANYRRIFVLTDKPGAALSLPANAVSLADTGDLELLL